MLAVNVVGCVLVGFLIVGILGGFTTFSAFGKETMNLLRTGELWQAGANILGHITRGLFSVWLAYSAASLFWK